MFLKRTVVSVLATLLVSAVAAEAAPIFVQTTGADFASLGAATPVGSPLASNFSGGQLSGAVVSQAFTDRAGNWLYLYQVQNTGWAGSDVITCFTTSPCTQAGEDVLMGYLMANIPPGFTLGDQAPLYGDVNVEAGPTTGFNFPVGNPFFGIPNSYIAPGKSSRVLYIQSSLAPGLVTGNVINGGVHTAQVIGPVPEPATMAVLALGGLFALARYRRGRAYCGIRGPRRPR